MTRLDGDANQGRGWRKVTFAEARIQLDLKEEGVKGQGVLGNEKNSLVEEIVVEVSFVGVVVALGIVKS